MKVLMLNGSANQNGTTFTALTEIGKILNQEGISYEIFQMGGGAVRDCIGCGQCSEKGCIFAEDGGKITQDGASSLVNEFVKKAKEADGFVFGTPVYYAHPSGRVLSFLDRVFYSSGRNFAFKPGASVAVARRGGTSSSLEVLDKYFGISQMPVVGSTYWNMVYGRNGGEAALDEEGMQTMRNLARNMAWMLKCFEAGRNAKIQLPETERGSRTNFIR